MGRQWPIKEDSMIEVALTLMGWSYVVIPICSKVGVTLVGGGYYGM